MADSPLNLESEADVAARTQIPERTLRQYRWRGVGPPYLKIGRHVRYVPDQVDRWLASQVAERQN